MATAAVGLGRVFEHEETMLVGEGVDRGHVRALPVKVNGQNSFRARRDECREAGGIKIVGARIGLAGNRRGADVGDGEPSGDVAVGGDDDLVTRADAPGDEHQLQGFKAVGDADAVGGADRRGVVGFEGLKLAAEEKPARIGDPHVRRIEFRAKLGGGGFEVEEGDGHGRGLGRSLR